jgi:hypothetical protein
MDIYFVRNSRGVSRPYHWDEAFAYQRRNPNSTILQFRIELDELLARSKPLTESQLKQSTQDDQSTTGPTEEA